MGKTLTYEQMMSLFAESRKETAELRANTAKETAELRTKAANEMSELRAELRAGIIESRKETAELRASIANLRVIVERNNDRLDKISANTQKNNDRLDKISADMQKNNDRLDKISTDMQKNNDRLDKNNKKLDENNEKLDKNNKKLDENNDKLDKNNHRIGLLTNKLGGIVESIVIPGIVDKFNEKGFSFDSVSTRVEFLNEEKDGNLAEVDALLENGSFVIAIETKTDMSVSDVNEHIKRLRMLRGISRFKGKKIYGALSTAIARKRPVNYALENGFYVLQQPDVMGVKILDFPKGCHAKAW